jgi:hypothetical protein
MRDNRAAPENRPEETHQRPRCGMVEAVPLKADLTMVLNARM